MRIGGFFWSKNLATMKVASKNLIRRKNQIRENFSGFKNIYSFLKIRKHSFPTKNNVLSSYRLLVFYQAFISSQ